METHLEECKWLLWMAHALGKNFTFKWPVFTEMILMLEIWAECTILIVPCPPHKVYSFAFYHNHTRQAEAEIILLYT